MGPVRAITLSILKDDMTYLEMVVIVGMNAERMDWSEDECLRI